MNQKIKKLMEETIIEENYYNNVIKNKKKLKPEISLFQAIKLIFNELYDLQKNKEKIISRHGIIIKLYEKFNYYDTYSLKNNGFPTDCYVYSLNSLDTIRNMLEKVGFLNKVYYSTQQEKIKFGYYSIQNRIPENLTQNKLRKVYNKFQKDLSDYYFKNNKYPDDNILSQMKNKLILELTYEKSNKRN